MVARIASLKADGTTWLPEEVSVTGFLGTGGAGLRGNPVDEDTEEMMLPFLRGIVRSMSVTLLLW